MSRLAVHQHRVIHRGRTFHFVAYQATPADAARDRAAVPATWFLMASGKRWEVMPEIAEQQEADREGEFMRWLDENVFGAAGKVG